MVIYDTVVIGSGVAGMTAAIYLKRANLNILLLEKSAPGGQINRTASITNYPGIKEIDGPSLSLNILEQLKSLDIETKYGNVLNIIDGEIKTIKTDLEEIKTKTVLIATGRNPKELGLEHEKQLTGRGVSWCAICDGPLYKDKTVAVVGGGNSAFEEALYLSTIVKKLYLIHRRDTFRADNILVEKLKEKENVEFILNSTITKLNEKDNHLESIEVNNKEIKVDGLFIYIGFKPETDIFNNLNLELDDGYILVDKNMKTNIKGIYAAGDVIKKDYYQISTAVGEAATAALTIKRDLE